MGNTLRGVPGLYEELARNGKFKDVEVDGRLEPQPNFVLPFANAQELKTHIWLKRVFPLRLFARLLHACLLLAGALFSWFTVSPQTLLLLHVVCVLCVHRYANERLLCPSGGFRGTAGFSVLQLRVQECDTQAASTFSSVAPVAQSLLRIDNKILWCQDTLRTYVQVI